MPLSENDQMFERTFADLAYTRLRDKAPGLLDYLVGFQLIDKNEDETRAVGVFGFKLGEDFLYAPMFFLNGELKGHELLYIKGRDAFVPLQENWVNFILNRKPYVLGKREERKFHELGIRNPDMGTFKKPLADEKVASASSYREIMVSTLDGVDFSQPVNQTSLTGFIKKAGVKVAKSLLRTLSEDTSFADAVLKFYSVEEIQDAVAAIPEQHEKRAGAPVIVYTDLSQVGSSLVGDDDKAKLLKEGYIVQDDREEGKKTQVRMLKQSTAVTTPDSDGIYEVITADGKTRTMLISSGGVLEQKDWLTPEAGNNSYQRKDTYLIDLENKSCYSAVRQEVLVTKKKCKEEEHEQLEKMSEPDSVSTGSTVVFVSPTCKATIPFKIESSFTGMNGATEYKTCYYPDAVSSLCSSGAMNRIQRIKHPRAGQYAADTDTPFYGQIHRICVTGKDGNKPTILGDTMFIPNGMKALVVKATAEELRLPNSAESVLELFKTAADGGLATLIVHQDNGRYWINIQNHRSYPLTKSAAISYLVVDLGMGEKDAESVLEDAPSRTASSATKYMLKFAEPLTDGTAYTSPNFPEPVPSYMQWSGVPMYEPTAYRETLGQQQMAGNKETYYTNDPSLDMTTRQVAEAAADKGQKEVLDTSVIGGLVKLTDTDLVLDDYISDLTSALDRIGRILFLFYWHNDKFKDRYGSQELIELEDSLRSNFKALGDLTLFLKQKTISSTGPGKSDLDLGTVLS